MWIRRSSNQENHNKIDYILINKPDFVQNIPVLKKLMWEAIAEC